MGFITCIPDVAVILSELFEKHRLWELLWGPHIYLEESRRPSNQMAATTEPIEPGKVAGLSLSRSKS